MENFDLSTGEREAKVAILNQHFIHLGDLVNNTELGISCVFFCRLLEC